MLDRPVSELCILADRVYRRHNADAAQDEGDLASQDDRGPASGALPEVGLALKSSAIQSGQYDGFKKVMKVMREQHPDIARGLGF